MSVQISQPQRPIAPAVGPFPLHSTGFTPLKSSCYGFPLGENSWCLFVVSLPPRLVSDELR